MNVPPMHEEHQLEAELVSDAGQAAATVAVALSLWAPCFSPSENPLPLPPACTVMLTSSPPGSLGLIATVPVIDVPLALAVPSVQVT